MIRPIENAYFALVVALVLGTSPGTFWSQTVPTKPETSWYWQCERGESKTMGLDMLLDGKFVYRSSFSVCRMRRAEVEPQQAGRKVVFSLKGGHMFQGEHRTSPKQVIEGNIWQAGGEADALLLGVSFSIKDRVLLNTVHLAKADRTSESKLDAGLLMRTYPLPRLHP